MRTILILIGSFSLLGCEAPSFYLGNDSDARLMCTARLSFKHHGVQIKCNSYLQPNEYLGRRTKNG